MKVGNGPSNDPRINNNVLRSVNRDKVSGISPIRLFPIDSKYCKDVKYPNSLGIGPSRLLSTAEKNIPKSFETHRSKKTDRQTTHTHKTNNFHIKLTK